MLEQTLRRYQNRGIEAAQVIEELIALAKEMREANARGEALDLTEDELAFYDALETNDSAVKVLQTGRHKSMPSCDGGVYRMGWLNAWPRRQNVPAENGAAPAVTGTLSPRTPCR
jgi:type I restriction enzyme R subunit